MRHSYLLMHYLSEETLQNFIGVIGDIGIGLAWLCTFGKASKTSIVYCSQPFYRCG